jgi:hypothetical protein
MYHDPYSALLPVSVVATAPVTVVIRFVDVVELKVTPPKLNVSFQEPPKSTSDILYRSIITGVENVNVKLLDGGFVVGPNVENVLFPVTIKLAPKAAGLVKLTAFPAPVCVTVTVPPGNVPLKEAPPLAEFQTT